MRLEWIIDDEELQKAIVDLFKFDQMLPRDYRAMYRVLQSMENHADNLARGHVCDETPVLELNKAQERGYIKAFYDIVQGLRSIAAQHQREII